MNFTVWHRTKVPLFGMGPRYRGTLVLLLLFGSCTFRKLQLSRYTVHLETAPINSLCTVFLKIGTSPNLIHSAHRSNNNSASQSLFSRTAQTYSKQQQQTVKRTNAQTHRQTNAQKHKHTRTSAKCKVQAPIFQLTIRYRQVWHTAHIISFSMHTFYASSITTRQMRWRPAMKKRTL